MKTAGWAEPSQDIFTFIDGQAGVSQVMDNWINILFILF